MNLPSHSHFLLTEKLINGFDATASVCVFIHTDRCSVPAALTSRDLHREGRAATAICTVMSARLHVLTCKVAR